MKKTMRRILACMTALGACLFLATVLPASTMNTIKDAVLRDSPSFLGKPVATLGNGTPIVLMSEEGDWAKVQAGEKQGWLPTSALRAKALSLQMGATRIGTGAQASEVALSGKGFSQESEANQRAKDPSMDFATVDRMESFVVSREDRLAFLKAGREGGAQ